MLFRHAYNVAFPARNYDVTPDGERFFMVRDETPPVEDVSEINIVLNWHDELERLVPADN